MSSGIRVTLINSNRMTPAIAPLGLDYVGGALRRAGLEVDWLDLCLEADQDEALRRHFSGRPPDLVGISFRNVDDCFWPSAAWFVPDLAELVGRVRGLSDAPIVLGGVGYSVFPAEILGCTGADFGIHGDGEESMSQLAAQLRGRRQWQQVPGLVWKADGAVRSNPPAWPETLSVPTERELADNATYFRLGGQIGVETKRGCHRRCAYCVDPLAKGPAVRARSPLAVAEEMESLLRQGIDVFHVCDAEFNLPLGHARDVCDELIRRRLGDRIRWYAYLAVVPFDADLAQRMARAGCTGINFTSDSASATMLSTYGQPHRQEDLRRAIQLCHEHGIAAMCDLLLGGPGETAKTIQESIRFFQQAGPDCVGTGLGLRLYPRTPIAARVAQEGPLETNPSLRRHYTGPVDLLRPTFYISAALGNRPAALVRELIAGDQRFFEPQQEAPEVGAPGDHNYNANRALSEAIAAGQRGAYWDILRKLRTGGDLD